MIRAAWVTAKGLWLVARAKAGWDPYGLDDRRRPWREVVPRVWRENRERYA